MAKAAKAKAKDVLTYRVERERTSGGYIADRLIIREARTENVAQRIAGCVDNADGYGSDEAAARMLKEYTALRAGGHAEFFDSRWNGVTIELRYLVYGNTESQERPDYCEPSLELPPTYSRVARAMKLLQRIGARVEKTRAASYRDRSGYERLPNDVGNYSFEHPQDVAAALDALGAVRVEKWTCDMFCVDVKVDPSKAKTQRAA